jgi:hypothetical protein
MCTCICMYIYIFVCNIYIFNLYSKCSKIRPVSKIRPRSSPYKAKKNEKWELKAFLLNNFFSKMIVEKNKAMAVFQSIYGKLYTFAFVYYNNYNFCLVLGESLVLIFMYGIMNKISSHHTPMFKFCRPRFLLCSNIDHDSRCYL